MKLATKKKQWLIDEFFELMEERGFLKNNQTSYKSLQKVITQKIRNTKAIYLANQCNEIEELEAKYV